MTAIKIQIPIREKKLPKSNVSKGNSNWLLAVSSSILEITPKITPVINIEKELIIFFDLDISTGFQISFRMFIIYPSIT